MCVCMYTYIHTHTHRDSNFIDIVSAIVVRCVCVCHSRSFFLLERKKERKKRKKVTVFVSAILVRDFDDACAGRERERWWGGDEGEGGDEREGREIFLESPFRINDTSQACMWSEVRLQIRINGAKYE